MKQKDLGVLGIVLIASVIISLLMSSLVFSDSSKQQEKVEVVDKITANFPVDKVKPKYFNDKSVDPTQLIQIGESNQHPFNGKNNDSQ